VQGRILLPSQGPVYGGPYPGSVLAPVRCLRFDATPEKCLDRTPPYSRHRRSQRAGRLRHREVNETLYTTLG
jgi:hypothetical protein